MKRTITLLLLALFTVPTGLYAQEDSDGYKIGVKAGWHYANLYRNGDANYGELNTFYISLFSETETSPGMKFGSAIEYFQNGFDNPEDGKFLLHTISLPAYGKVFIGPAYALVGLGLNFRIVDNRQDFPGGIQTNIKITDTKLLDLPVALGLGLELGPILIEAKYSWITTNYLAGTFNSDSNNAEGKIFLIYSRVLHRKIFLYRGNLWIP